MCLQVLAEWCKQTDALLAESEAGTATPLNDESGPDTELEFWRVRMAKFNSVTEQMKSKECRLVMGVCSTARSKQYKRWKEVDIKVQCSGVLAHILRAVYIGIRPCLTSSSICQCNCICCLAILVLHRSRKNF